MKVSEKLIIQNSTFLCIHQIVLNLLSNNDETNEYLGGEIFDYHLCFKSSLDRPMTRAAITCCSIAYLFHDYTLAQKFIDICTETIAGVSFTYFNPIFIFYRGLVSLSFAKQSETKEKWLQNAEDSILKLQEMSQTAPENFLNKVRLNHITC